MTTESILSSRLPYFYQTELKWYEQSSSVLGPESINRANAGTIWNGRGFHARHTQ